MIYVMAGNYQQFQGFLQEFQLREDFGNNYCSVHGCRRGQVRYLGESIDMLDRIRGGRSIVLRWGTWFERRDASMVEDFCKALDIPLVEVPDLHRARALKERPEMFRQW
jgi:hypothetical protein